MSARLLALAALALALTPRPAPAAEKPNVVIDEWVADGKGLCGSDTAFTTGADRDLMMGDAVINLGPNLFGRATVAAAHPRRRAVRRHPVGVGDLRRVARRVEA